MKTVSEYGQQMLRIKDSPDALVDLKIELSANLVSLLDTEYKPVKLLKADFWHIKENICEIGPEGNFIEILKAREKPLSDTMVESLWKLTPGGSKEIRLEITTKSYKILIEACTTAITWAQSSARLER